MSQHNRDRRTHRYRCGKCGMPFHQEAMIDENETRAAAWRAAGQSVAPVNHVCGICRTIHRLEAGTMRQLTPAELFELNMRAPETMRAIETAETHWDGRVTVYRQDTPEPPP